MEELKERICFWNILKKDMLKIFLWVLGIDVYLGLFSKFCFF